jgi:hypothetical protein
MVQGAENGTQVLHDHVYKTELVVAGAFKHSEQANQLCACFDAKLTNSIIDPLNITECTMSALMADNPDASCESALPGEAGHTERSVSNLTGTGWISACNPATALSS